MARRSNLRNLVFDAFSHGEATAGGRNWRATRVNQHRNPDYVGIEHHGTHMFNVTRGGVVEPVDSGWGSATDRGGVRAITSGYGCVGTDCGIGYRELFYDEPMGRASDDLTWRNAIQRDPELRVTPEDRSVRMSPPRSRAAGRSSSQFTYTPYLPDMNPRGPDYSQPDPFDFSDPEQASQAQEIEAMEETIRGLDERSSRPRNEG